MISNLPPNTIVPTGYPYKKPSSSFTVLYNTEILQSQILCQANAPALKADCS